MRWRRRVHAIPPRLVKIAIAVALAVLVVVAVFVLTGRG
jgi:hypothetical protein